MKTNLIYLNSRKLVILLFGVLFSVSLFAQTDWTGNVLTVPTEDGISLLDDMTRYNLNYSGHHTDGPEYGEADGGFAIEYTQANDWIEYTIVASESGQYALTIAISSARADSYTNVSVYPEDSAFVMNGTTSFTSNGEWQKPDDYIFPFYLEADVVYIMRVSLIDNGCNIFDEGLTIKSLDGPTDATLKDISIDGITIPGFDPDVYNYSIALPPYGWINSLTAVANDSTATVVIPEEVLPEDQSLKGSAVITCQSLGGIVLTYTINIAAPTEVFDGSSLGLNEKDVFYNNGVNALGSKLNSINNNAYLEYYIFSDWEDNYAVTIECTNGYEDAESYLNVSTLATDDSTWVLADRNSQYIPITYAFTDPTDAEWDKTLTTPNTISYIIQLKGNEPVRLRIYGVTNQSNAADITNISFAVVTESIDNTLSSLTVGGDTVPDFDPAITNYTVPLAIGTTQVEIGATANSADAEVTSGIGTFDIFNGTAEVVCTSEAGYPMTYNVSFQTPKAIHVGDTLAMGDDVYYTPGNVKALNNKVNYLGDSMYVEYYIYSETDADMHVTILAANGYLDLADTMYNKLNIGTYTPGTEWSSEMGITKNITSEGWTTAFASEYEYNISLIANEPVILRIFSFTNANRNTAADIHKITFGDGHTTAGGIDDGVSASIEDVVGAVANVKVITANRSLSVIGNETMLGASIEIFDISGRLVVNKIANSTNESYPIDQSGIYIVRVVSPADAVSTVKCVVR